MVRSACFLVVSCALLTALPAALSAAEADGAAEVFESLYGSDVKRAKATRDAKDDVELAGRLLEAARKTTGQPAFLAVLCEKACDLASGHPDGYATAIGAMELLAGEVPDRAAACAETLVEIREKQFSASRGDERVEAGEALIDLLLYLADGKLDAGDPPGALAFCRRAQKVARATKSERMKEIDARLRSVAQTMKAKREAEHLKAQLEKDPNDGAAREKLVRLYLVDLDNPAVALEYVAGVADESLRKYVPAAAKGTEGAPELACAELGDWYRGLAEKAPSGAKPAMYARARGYYERFLELHTAADLRRTAVGLALKKVEAALKKLGAAAPSKSAKGKWIDLLPLVDPAKNAVKGEWKRHGGMLAITKLIVCGRIMVPVAPEGSYELQVKFVRTSGDQCVAVILPVGSARVILMLSRQHGQDSGLELINGKYVENNETAVRPGTLVNGHEYALDIAVVAKGDQAWIAVRLDGKPYIDWRGPQSAFSVPAHWHLAEPGCLGLGAWESTVVFRTARLKMLTGKARLLRPPDE